jgi:E3 ubiquitin-protein ligase SHPRH
LLKEAIVRGGEASGPEANTGDKRPLDPPSPSHPAIEAKRVKLENGTTEVLLPVAHLRSSFEGEVRDDPVAGKEDGKAFFAILRTLPAYQQQLHLTTVTFSRPRSSPDGLTITTPESRDIDNKLPLISVHALDYLASGFEIFPHPKRGKKQYAYFQQGCGGLLDAIVELASSQDLTLQSSLSLSYSKPNLTFHLSLSVSLCQSFFTQSSSKTMGPKRILLEFLFPSPKLPIDHPGTTVDFFYRCLHRAPRTRGGLVVEKDAPLAVEETEAAREARVRKESKGKGKAIEDEKDEGEGEVEWDNRWREDEILTPAGLKATLMPFQSRTLRWLLSREGKVARLVPPFKGDEDVTMEEAVHDVHEHETEHLEHQAEEPAAKCELHDLPLEIRQDIARGPLWERVALDLVGEREGETLLYWFNRVTTALQVEDPTSGYGDEAAKQGEDDEVVIVEEKGDIFGNGLVTGGGLLSEEMGLGKTIMIISLILMRAAILRLLFETLLTKLGEQTINPTATSSPATTMPGSNPTSSPPTSPSSSVPLPSSCSGNRRSPSTLPTSKSCATKYVPLPSSPLHSLTVRVQGTKTVSEDWTPAYIAQHFDVMLTTFDVLKKEVNLARKPHRHGTRSGEEKPRYRR